MKTISRLCLLLFIGLFLVACDAVTDQPSDDSLTNEDNIDSLSLEQGDTIQPSARESESSAGVAEGDPAIVEQDAGVRSAQSAAEESSPPISAFAQVYYVDSGGSDGADGSLATPWQTIQHAVDTVVPGDTIMVQSGTYDGARIEQSGTAADWITLQAAPSSNVLINAPGPNNLHDSNLELETWNGDGTVAYWIIDGLEVANAPNWGIDTRGNETTHSHHIIIRNNTVHDNGLATGKTGIFFAFVDDTTVEGNESYNNGEHGIYLSNSGDRFLVDGNALHDNVNCGLHMNGDLSIGGDGIISDGVVENNTIYENGVGGCSGINMDGVTDAIVRNNLLYENHAGGIALYQTDGAVCTQNIQVLNNTIVQATDGRWAINITASDCINNKVFNNIILTSHAWRGSIVIPTAGLTGFESDYNVIMDRFSADNDNSVITLAAWQALGFDANSIIATPAAVFAGASDYHLHATSPALDIGVTLADVPTDLEGTLRPQGIVYDIGAFEYYSPVGVSYTVNTITDTDDGTCDGTHCSLREAINAANASPTKDTINFDIAGAGPHTITVTTLLPTITQPVIVDGTSEPDYVDAPIVEIDANGTFDPNDPILDILGGDSVIKGLSLYKADYDTQMLLRLQGGGGNVIQGNYINLDSAGNPGLMAFYGIWVIDSANNQIGGTGASEGNVIARVWSGIHIAGNGTAGSSEGNKVQGNLIGLDPTGTVSLETGDGVMIFDASNNLIGGSGAGEGNLIQLGNCAICIRGFAYPTDGNVIQGNIIGVLPVSIPEDVIVNGVHLKGNATNTIVGGTNPGEGNTIRYHIVGVVLEEDSDGEYPTGNRISGNSIYDNIELGIDFLGKWEKSPIYIPNDLGDSDAGPNNQQNYPVLTSVTDVGATRDIVGTLNSAADTTFRIEYFSNATCSPSGYGEGETYLGFIDVITDGSGNADISTSFADAIPLGYFITTTATDPAGNTSEFSACEIVSPLPQTFVVNTITDTDDGTCDVTHCSLREAINAANLYPNKDTINFDIAGAGPHTIQPTTTLPTITDPIILDATTEPDYAGSPVIEIDGINTSTSSGFSIIYDGDVTIKGFAIHSFDTTGIHLTGGLVGDYIIQDNYIGTDVTGTTAGTRTQLVGLHFVAGNVLVENNLISGNIQNIFMYTSNSGYALYANNTIRGNKIGTDATGTYAVRPASNPDNDMVTGIFVYSTNGLKIGGTGIGDGNLISGNDVGIMMAGDDDIVENVTVEGNLIGTDSSGTASLPNDFYGVSIIGHVYTTMIGGLTTGAANVIAYNGDIGVFLDKFPWTLGAGYYPYTSDGITIRGNSIHSNGGLGIDLDNDDSLPLDAIIYIGTVADGVTPNDSGDGDDGMNHRQNYPILTSADGDTDTIIGMLNSEVNKTYILDFYSSASCDANGYGEGETYIGSASVSTNGSGNAAFSEVFAGKIPGGSYITATATAPDGSTSEFSACAGSAGAPPFTDCASVGVISETECNALDDLYTSTVGANWTTNTDWFASNAPCTWFGVLCSGGKVIALNLGGNNLIGTIPISIGDLSGLEILDLGGNKINGGIPTELGSLANLTTLNLAANALSGEIPAAFSNLTNLATADIGKNALTTSNGNILALLGTVDPDWADTQTVAPLGVAVEAYGYSRIKVTWTPINYTAPNGYYEISIGTSPGGPYTVVGKTDNLTQTSLMIEGLDLLTDYYVVVRTYTEASGEQQNNLWSSYSVEATGQTGAPTSPPGNVQIDSITASLDGSGPYTITLTIEGQYPSGCGGRMNFDQQIDGTNIYIDMVQMEKPGDRICGGSVKPFSITFTLDGMYSGATYTIYLNGQTIEVIVP